MSLCYLLCCCYNPPVYRQAELVPEDDRKMDNTKCRYGQDAGLDDDERGLSPVFASDFDLLYLRKKSNIRDIKEFPDYHNPYDEESKPLDCSMEEYSAMLHGCCQCIKPLDCLPVKQGELVYEAL